MDDDLPENIPESVSMKVAEDAVPVCPNCLEPCDPLANYCPNCGSNEAINPLASYMPFVDLRFRVGMIAKLWRKAWSSNTGRGLRLFYMGVFILFMPILFVIALPFVIVDKLKSKENIQAEQDSEL